MSALDRRRFLQASAASVAALSALTAAGAADKPNEKIVLAVIGVHGRGRGLLQRLLRLRRRGDRLHLRSGRATSSPALKALNEADRSGSRRSRRTSAASSRTRTLTPSSSPRRTTGTPWPPSGPARPASTSTSRSRSRTTASRAGAWSRPPASTTASCRSARSGAAARTSTSAAEFVRSGKLGKVPFARTWIAGNRKTIGQKADGAGAGRRRLRPLARPGPGAAVQPEPLPLQLALELGLRHRRDRQQRHPRPRRGRAGCSASTPRRASSAAAASSSTTTTSRRRTRRSPPSISPAPCVVWEHRIWSKTRRARARRSASSCTARRARWSSTARAGTSPTASKASDKAAEIEKPHLRNFLDCVTSGKRPNADIEEGHKSTRLVPPGQHRLPRRPRLTLRRRDGNDLAATRRRTSCWAGPIASRSWCRRKFKPSFLSSQRAE